MTGPRRTWRARAVRRKAPVEAGSFRRGGACARGVSYGGAHLMSLTAAAGTAAQVTTPSRRSPLCSRRRPWGARSQWAARPCKGGVLLTAPLGLVHGDHRPAGLVTEALVTREGTGSMRRYFYRRVRLLGRSLAFGMGLLGWRCARSAQRGVPPPQGDSSRLMVPPQDLHALPHERTVEPRSRRLRALDRVRSPLCNPPLQRCLRLHLQCLLAEECLWRSSEAVAAAVAGIESGSSEQVSNMEGA